MPLRSPAPHPHPQMHPASRLSALQRQALAFIPAVIVGTCVAALGWGGGETPLLAAWLTFCLVDLWLVSRLMVHLDAEATRLRAQWMDPGAHFLMFIITASAVASVGAVALGVKTANAHDGLAHGLLLALAMASLAASWLIIQVAFALHYARVYYRPQGHPSAHPSAASPQDAGGLAFPDDQPPDYADFLYFSAVIGMTSQVSDVNTASRRMRRLVLGHGLLAFAFNLVVLALGINVVASSLMAN